MVHVATAVAVILTAFEITLIDAVNVEEHEERPHEDVIRNRDQKHPVIFENSPNLGQYFFEPGAGRTYRELPHGKSSAVVQWWPRNISTPEQAKAEGKLSSYSWVFNVG